MTNEAQEKYEKQTGEKALYRKGSSDYHTLKYVRWLEQELYRQSEEDKIKVTVLENKISVVKRIMFDMWQRVENGQFDARSFVGDTALDMRDNIFSSEEDFRKEYAVWKSKK